MLTTPKGEFLLVVFRPELTLALLEVQPPSGFAIAGATYRVVPTDDYAGFYDWLRSRTGRIIGVRYWLQDGSVLTALSRRAYVHVPPDRRCIEIFFGKSRESDEARSNDQAFGGVSHFVADSGEWAISFETYFLEPAEIQAIREGDGRWVSVTYGSEAAR
jgi:hypothetical protein